MPELIAQTNMDQQSVVRLRDEIVKLTGWLGRNSDSYFRNEYENSSQEYQEKVKNM
jgi:mortality factor 4-like protein 1